MAGDEKLRLCSKCGKYVHDVSQLSVGERLALLSEKDLCGRYRVALRRARPFARESYAKHLIKYGASVAVASGAFLVFWELSDERAEQELAHHYRVVVPGNSPIGEMPAEFYEEQEVQLMGMIAVPPEEVFPPELPVVPPPDHIDIKVVEPIHSLGHA